MLIAEDAYCQEVAVARKGRKAACVRRDTVLEVPTHHQLGGAVKPRALSVFRRLKIGR